MAEAEKAADLSALVTAGADKYDDIDTSNLDLGNDMPSSEPESVAEPVTEPPEPEETTAEEPESGEKVQESGQTDDKTWQEAEEEPEEPVLEDKKGEPKIPKARFDEVNERRKAAERRLAQLEKEKEAFDPFKAVDFDFDDAEKRYMEAVLDGESDKALQIRKEIRAAEFSVAQANAQRTAEQNRALTHAEIQLKSAISEIENEIPQLRVGSEVYDAELTAEVLDLFEGFKTRGYDADVALRKAANYVASYNGLGAVAETSPEPVAELRKAKSSTTPDQTRKKLEVAGKQPPSPTVRNDERGVDVMSLSESEFDKLGKDQLARLRGDII
jgi:hypothetical protein